MSYVIKLIELATGEPDPNNGKYVTYYDPAAFGGRGDVRTTADIDHALHFDDGIKAWEFWRQSAGYRSDGRPNRPLTAWTVDIQPTGHSVG